jgi:hypothetical protein
MKRDETRPCGRCVCLAVISVRNRPAQVGLGEGKQRLLLNPRCSRLPRRSVPPRTQARRKLRSMARATGLLLLTLLTLDFCSINANPSLDSDPDPNQDPDPNGGKYFRSPPSRPVARPPLRFAPPSPDSQPHRHPPSPAQLCPHAPRAIQYFLQRRRELESIECMPAELRWPSRLTSSLNGLACRSILPALSD